MSDHDRERRDDAGSSRPDDAAGAMRPDQSAAAARADEIAFARDHPAQVVARPPTVVWGCVLTWVGAVALAGYSALALSINKDSTVFGDDLTKHEVDTAVKAYHDLGIALGIWAGLLAVFAFFAFRGIQWAATVLLSMAALVGLLMLVAVVTTLAVVGLLTGSYSIAAAYLIRRSPRSREWFEALRRPSAEA